MKNNNYQNGEVQVNHNRFLGYTKDEDGHLIIEPTEAEVVKRIYRELRKDSTDPITTAGTSMTVILAMLI